jgi:CBS domain-containing protein
MRVNEKMHKGVEWVSPDTPIATLAQKMLQYDIGAIPVGENDRLVGMVTDRDISVRAVANGGDISKLTAKDVMTKGVIWCRDSQDLEDAAHIMESKKVRRLPVINENKRMVGMLSLGDISHAEARGVVAGVMKAVSGHHALTKSGASTRSSVAGGRWKKADEKFLSAGFGTCANRPHASATQPISSNILRNAINSRLAPSLTWAAD